MRAAVGQLNDPNATAVNHSAPAPPSFKKAIEALQTKQTVNYNGASGNVDFDANGDTRDYATLWKIQGGQFVETAVLRLRLQQHVHRLGTMLPAVTSPSAPRAQPLLGRARRCFLGSGNSFPSSFFAPRFS